MTDKPILFSAPMIRALLGGRKTQTRRAFKPQPVGLGEGQIPQQRRIAIGDRIWVREAWRAHAEFDPLPPRDIPPGSDVQYVADAPVSPWDSRYRHGMFMPRWASRLTLIVTDVRVQRLWEITPADSIAEGCPAYANSVTIDCDTPDPRDDFISLWKSINGPDAWDANPWVAAYTFSAHKCNIDAMPVNP